MTHTPADKDFELHAQIRADSHFVRNLPLCELRLMNDTRFRWLLLIPRLTNVSEVTDLSGENQQLLMQEISAASASLKTLTECKRINIAAFGNIVPQLHIHIIARHLNDPTWPGSAIGFGTREPASHAHLELFAAEICAVMIDEETGQADSGSAFLS